MIKDEKKAEKRIVAMIREEYPATKLVYIFGSRADGTQNDRSDIDIAFWLDETADALDVFYLQEKIAMEFSVDVDLIELKSSSEVFKYEVVTTGRNLFEISIEYTDIVEDKIWRDYLYLNEIRKDIVNDKFGRIVL